MALRHPAVRADLARRIITSVPDVIPDHRKSINILSYLSFFLAAIVVSLQFCPLVRRNDELRESVTVTMVQPYNQ